MKLIKKFLKVIKPQTKQEWIEAYLAQSVDRYDLEARQLELTRKGIF